MRCRDPAVFASFVAASFPTTLPRRDRSFRRPPASAPALADSLTMTDDVHHPLRCDLALDELLTLDARGAASFVNQPRDVNENGRSYGGHSIALALLAAGRTVDAARSATSLQCTFLQGIRLDQAVTYQVTTLMDGKRFSLRHVRASQGTQAVLEAQVSFAKMGGPAALRHATAAPAGIALPEDSARADELPTQLGALLLARCGYSFAPKACLEFRIPRPQQLVPDGPAQNFEYWVRATSRPDGAHSDEAVLAYLSDWWLNYCTVATHLCDSDGALYVASLNHSLYFYGNQTADDWRLLVSESPIAAHGRAVATGRIYDRQGQFLAVATQECLLTERTAALTGA